MACAMASRCFMPWLYVRTLRWIAVAEPGDLQGLVEARVGRGPAGGLPVQAQVSRPVRCGRKPGPSTSAPSRRQHRRAGRQAVPEDEDLAGGRLGQPHQHPQRRGLAGAVRAEQADDLSTLDGEVHRRTPRRSRRRTPCAARARPAACRRTRRSTGCAVAPAPRAARPARPRRARAAISATSAASTYRQIDRRVGDRLARHGRQRDGRGVAGEPDRVDGRLRPGVANAWSEVAIVIRSRCPASNRCTIAGSVTVTGCASAMFAGRPVSRTGAISPIGRRRPPSWSTS